MKKAIIVLLCVWLSVVMISASELKIEGNDVVEIAMQGESIAQYHAPDGYEIALSEEVSGVEIDENAILHVSTSAKEGRITLIARGDQTLSKEIQLLSSWTVTVEGAQEYQIPSPKQTRKIDYMDKIYNWFPIHIIQITLGGITVMLLLLYIYKRRKR